MLTSASPPFVSPVPDIRYSKVHAVSTGSGPPVVLIHGISASLHQWDALAPRLAAAGFSAHALDLLGHGRSGKPDCPNGYQIEDVYNHLARWVDTLGLGEPPVFIGHSLGGYLSLLYALRQPENVRAVVLTSPYVAPGQLRGVVQFSLRHPARTVEVLRRVPRRAVAWTLMLSGRTGGEPLTKAMRERIAEDYKRTHPQVIHLPASTPDLSARLREVHAPTLLIWGERDLTLSPGWFPRIARLLPTVQTHSFPHTGHNPHLTQAKAYNQLVLDFVGNVFLPEA